MIVIYHDYKVYLYFCEFNVRLLMSSDLGI